MSTESDIELCRRSIRKMRNPEPIKIDSFAWGFGAGVFFCLLLALSGCTNAMTILEGSTHACGTIHAEGYFTDSQGDVVVVKAPVGWTPEQVLAFCQITQ